MPGPNLVRRAAGGALVIAAAALTVLAARGVRNPAAPVPAPEYRSKGRLTAPIQIVEYSDFQCPACRAAEDPVKKILEMYGDKLRFVYKHFPLEMMHPHARPAAIASECAGRQGMFWELHDLLYDEQRKWSESKDQLFLDQYAKKLKLDMKAFESCRKDPAVDDAVDADQDEGDDRWVNSTPTFFINGRRFAGAKQLSTRGVRWIDKSLAK